MSTHVTRLPQLGRPTEIEGVSEIVGSRPGPVVAFMGLVHGNEHAGTAIWETMATRRDLDCGSIRLIVGHPAAAFGREVPVRQIDEDLNRAFFFDAIADRPESVEAARVRQLRRALVGVDVLVDFHTTSSVSEPFCALFGDGHERAQFRSVRRMTATFGWDRFVSGAGVQWVRKHGGTGFIVEAGQHDDPVARCVVAAVVEEVLADLGMDGAGRDPRADQLAGRQVEIVRRVSVAGRGFRYVVPPVNFAPLAPGALIARDAQHSYYARLEDGPRPVLVMPTAEGALKDQVTGDAFFIGVER